MGGPRRWLWTVLAVLPAVAAADEVHLTSGGIVRGVIVERTDQAVVIETGPGRVTLPLARVSRIVDGGSALATFQERAARIGFDDVEGLANLARWAGDHDLATHARHSWERVLALDPGHPGANAALGRAYIDGVWMSEQGAPRLPAPAVPDPPGAVDLEDPAALPPPGLEAARGACEAPGPVPQRLEGLQRPGLTFA